MMCVPSHIHASTLSVAQDCMRTVQFVKATMVTLAKFISCMNSGGGKYGVVQPAAKLWCQNKKENEGGSVAISIACVELLSG